MVCIALTPPVRLCFAQISELCHEIEDRDDALAKARETAHKAQLQKYQASHAPFYWETFSIDNKTMTLSNSVSVNTSLFVCECL